MVCAGFGGISLGSTPTAMANMSAVANRYGASHLAFIVVPLVCAFFIDLVNAADSLLSGELQLDVAWDADWAPWPSRFWESGSTHGKLLQCHGIERLKTLTCATMQQPALEPYAVSRCSPSERIFPEGRTGRLSFRARRFCAGGLYADRQNGDLDNEGRRINFAHLPLVTPAQRQHDAGCP